ncbi:AMP-binding protein [Orrella marina]|uniref:Long-chain fatty acid--CoA ligase n=1 Tax=Orrella marina TaxID=2163011 RepID=A0A2R4XMH0_9BURK|nr:AMP-binding protein [Orrella marina]AWB35002.1 long-chain fatty acid--CoA ligase [Orrella marina]
MSDRSITIEGRTIDRQIVEERSLKLASGLASLGIREGDVVAVFMRNRQAYLETILACRRLGVYYCPVNWHFTAKEVQYILEDSGAKIILTQTELLPVAIEANANDTEVICVGLSDSLATATTAVPATYIEKAQDYDKWIRSHSIYEGPIVSPRGHMAYTSGTTGRPKGVVRFPVPLEDLKENQAVVARIVEKAYGLRPGARALLPAPIYHSAPSLFCQMSLLMCDHLVVTDRFDPEDLLQHIEKYRIEVAYMVPIMYVRLLRLEPAIRQKYDVSSLRFVASTGSPCPPDVKRQMIEWFGPVIHETYASSEGGLITLATPEDALAKPGTAGKPVETATIRILGADGKTLPAGEAGHIYVKNTAYADFTYRNRPESRQAIEHDGLITLGDIGYLDEDGYLFVCDRETDMVLSGGVNIYPAEIEHALVGYPGIADCAVIGMPDEEFGQRLVGVIQTNGEPEIPALDLVQWLSRQLARFKIPRSYLFMESLPRDPNGKISRSRLRQNLLRSTRAD